VINNARNELALRELGYIEGQNIATEYRYAEGKRDRYPELTAELVRLKVDVILVAGGVPMVQAAKNATKTIPIVMTGSGSDPVEAGLIESLAHPGGNVTGLTNLNRELGEKRLELFKEAVPKVVCVAVLYDPALPGSVREVKEVLPVAARALRLTLQPWEVRAADDFDRVFAALNKQRPDGLYVHCWPLAKTDTNVLRQDELWSPSRGSRKNVEKKRGSRSERRGRVCEVESTLESREPSRDQELK